MKAYMIFLNGLMTSVSQRGKCSFREPRDSKVFAQGTNPASIKSSINNKQNEVVLMVNREKLNYAKSLKGQEV